MKINKSFDIVIVGGGAAGFFAAINIAEQNPNLKIAILERGKTGLQKVKISNEVNMSPLLEEGTPDTTRKMNASGKQESILMSLSSQTKKRE